VFFTISLHKDSLYFFKSFFFRLLPFNKHVNKWKNMQINTGNWREVVIRKSSVTTQRKDAGTFKALSASRFLDHGQISFLFLVQQPKLFNDVVPATERWHKICDHLSLFTPRENRHHFLQDRWPYCGDHLPLLQFINLYYGNSRLKKNAAKTKSNITNCFAQSVPLKILSAAHIFF